MSRRIRISFALTFSLALHLVALAFLWRWPGSNSSPIENFLDVRVSYEKPKSQVQSQVQSRESAPIKSKSTPHLTTGATSVPTAQPAPPSDAQTDFAAPAAATTHSQSSSEAVENIEGSALGISVVYPRLSRMMGENGIVIIHFDSKTHALNIEKSSGFPRLDHSALSAAQDAFDTHRVAPPTKESKIRFVFVLKKANE